MTGPSAGDAGPGARWARLDWVLLALGWLLLWAFEPHHVEADGAVRFEALRQIVETGRWSPTEFPMVGTVLSAPLYLLGRWIESPVWWVARYNLLLAGVGLVALWRLLRGGVEGGVLRGALLLLLAGSI